MLLEAKDISYRYEKKKNILNKISLQIEEGEKVGLIGPSGCGKSTLAKILAGYLLPEGGGVLLDEKPLPQKGYCPVQLIYQHPEKALNPQKKLKYSLCEGFSPSAELLKSMAIKSEWLNRWPNELSGGELQRFCIARILGEKTRFLIADEISTMLDAVSQAQIWKYLLGIVERRSMGMLVITHNKALAYKICDRVIDFKDIKSAIKT